MLYICDISKFLFFKNEATKNETEIEDASKQTIYLFN